MNLSGVDLGGFSITSSTQITVIIVFLIYSVLVICLGLYVKHTERKSSSSKLASFITGGGDLNAFEVAMITATVTMAGGTMVGAPSLSYRTGLVYTLCYLSTFISVFITLATFGKKFAIIRQRINAQTISQLMFHRFQSKTVVIGIVICGSVFCTIMAGGQLISASKVFAAITGGQYILGLIISSIAVAVYTFSGGIKSLARVAVVQGLIMLAAVCFFAFAQYKNILDQHGSIQAGMEMLSSTNGAILTTKPWMLLNAIGAAAITGWGVSGIPSSLQSSMYYRKPSVLIRAAVIGVVVMVCIMVVMAPSGPLTAILNPNLQNPDWATIYVSTNFLPGWMAGIFVCGIFAAIQSSIAGFLIITGGSIAVDVFRTCIKPNASEKTVQKVNLGIIAVAVAIAFIIALRPMELVQTLLLFGNGCCAAGYLFPCMFGTYWKKTTAPAMASAVILAPLSYIATHLISTSPSTSAWYVQHLGNLHPMLVSIIVGIVLLIAVSLCTQDKKVPLGIYKVWFCKDYDDEFTTMYNANKTANYRTSN